MANAPAPEAQELIAMRSPGKRFGMSLTFSGAAGAGEDWRFSYPHKSRIMVLVFRVQKSCPYRTARVAGSHDRDTKIQCGASRNARTFFFAVSHRKTLEIRYILDAYG
jgi:hypothetical protein